MTDATESSSGAWWRAEALDRLERMIWSVADERRVQLRDAELGGNRYLAAALFRIQCEGIEFVWRAALSDVGDAATRFREARRGEGLRLSNAWDGAAGTRHWIAPIAVVLNEHGDLRAGDWRAPSGDGSLVLVERVEVTRTKIVSDAVEHEEAVRMLELIRQLDPKKKVRLERERTARAMAKDAAGVRAGSDRRGALHVVCKGTDRIDLRTEQGRFEFTLSLAREVRRKGEAVVRDVRQASLPPKTASLCVAMHLDGVLRGVEAVVPGETGYLASVASRLEEEKAIARDAIEGAAPDYPTRGGARPSSSVTSIEVARERRRGQKDAD